MTKPVKPRSYRSPLREEQAAATRRRIVDAAAGLFVQLGYGPTSIKQVAQIARVAPDTVYATFGSKARLLTAVIDSRLVPSGTTVLQRPEAEALRDEADPRRFLHMFAQDYAAMRARVGPVREVLRTAKAVDPQMADVLDEIEGYRFDYAHTIVQWLAKRARLRLPTKRAAQVVWALASPDVGHMLCDVQGWTTDEYADWLSATLVATLLPSPSAPEQPAVSRRTRARPRR